MNDRRTLIVISFALVFQQLLIVLRLGFSNIVQKKSQSKQRQIMLRLRLATCHRFNFFPTAQKGDEQTVMHPREAPSPVQKIADYWAIYQGIDLTRNKILINVINDVVADRFSTLEQNHDLHMQRNSVPKKHKTRISLVKPKEPIKMLEVC